MCVCVCDVMMGWLVVCECRPVALSLLGESTCGAKMNMNAAGQQQLGQMTGLWASGLWSLSQRLTWRGLEKKGASSSSQTCTGKWREHPCCCGLVNSAAEEAVGLSRFARYSTVQFSLLAHLLVSARNATIVTYADR